MPKRIILDDSEICKLYERGFSSTKIAKEIGVSQDTIRDRLKRNNIILKIGRIKKDFDIDKLYYLYKNGETLGKLSNKFNISATTIANNFRLNSLSIERTGPKRKIEINDFIFSKFTPESCYWAGFIAADGNIYDNQLSIHLKDIDIEHLENFVNFVGLKGSNVFIKPNGKNNSCLVRFRSNQIVKDLKKIFNIIPNKSLILRPPNINNFELIRNYIRGCFDGDGCFSYGVSKQMSFEVYSGSKDILEWILKNIKKLNVSKKVKIYNKSINCFRFNFTGNKQVKIIMDWLYKEPNIYYLQRKFKKYKKHQ